jgi:hypothetical protein
LQNYLAIKLNIYRIIVNSIEDLVTKLDSSLLQQLEDLNLLLTLPWTNKGNITIPELGELSSDEVISLCKKCIKLITLPVFDVSETKKIFAFCINKESRIPLKCACIEYLPLLYYYSGVTVDEALSLL